MTCDAVTAMQVAMSTGDAAVAASPSIEKRIRLFLFSLAEVAAELVAGVNSCLVLGLQG